MSELTYDELEQMLRSLGFSVHLLDEHIRGYQHDASGARLTLPNLPGQEKVLPRHVMAVRTVLDAFGFPEPEEFAGHVPRAG